MQIDSSSLPERIRAAIQSRSMDMERLARRIHSHPELCFEEHKAVEWLTEAIESAGIQVERGVGGLPTAFRAKTGTAGGPRIALLAEYDALPDIGHACGHNLIGTGAVAAFLGLAAVANDLPGEVVLLGTPAEEGGGGKIKLLAAGAFDGLDAAMMFHPCDRDLLTFQFLASEMLTFQFVGRPAHAAAKPWEGRSALTAVIQTFNLIDSQRLHFHDGCRVHGIIRDGGQAVNIVVEKASCVFNVRAPHSEWLSSLAERVIRCAEGAAAVADVDVIVTRAPGYRNMISNMTLARVFGESLGAVGRPDVPDHDPEAGVASSDMGDVSHVVPSIHPMLAICGRGVAMCHERAFTELAASGAGMQTMGEAAQALALTASRFLEDPCLRERVRAEFAASTSAP